MTAGSLQNVLYNDATCKTPEVGDGATLIRWTDRQAATVVEVSRTGHRVTVQHDHAERTDTNGMSDAQSYAFTRNPNGRTEVCTRRRDGSYRLAGSSERVLFGGRDHYHDFSF
jgi:hypothetical protein